jgi:hypothetical protein
VRLTLNVGETFNDFGIDQLYEDAGRGDESLHPLWAALLKARRAGEAVEALWEQDQAAYAEAFKETARRLLAVRELSVGVEVVVNQSLDVSEWGELADELDNTARPVTPLPMIGTAPDWSDGTPADALRRAGFTTWTVRREETGIRKNVDKNQYRFSLFASDYGAMVKSVDRFLPMFR